MKNVASHLFWSVIGLLLCIPFAGSAQTTSFSYSGSIQTYTVPSGVTSIRIEAKGARGGGHTHSGNVGGNGATMTGDFTVVPGQQLRVLVGGMGTAGTYVGGGGGGSFVWVNSSNALLVAAGGGGGAGYSTDGSGAVTSQNGLNGHLISNGGGINGQGGTTPGGYTNWAAGGAGWFSNGNNGSVHGCTPNSMGGLTPLNGGAGGSGGGIAGSGGFGGGGGGNARCGAIGGGGGGGYSGGGAGAEYVAVQFPAGGGAGSFNNGSNQNNTPSNNTGNGTVAITVLQTVAGALKFDGSDDYVNVNNTLGNFGTGDFTVETWFRTSQTTTLYLISKRSVCGPSTFWNLLVHNGKLSMEMMSGGNHTPLDGTANVNDGQWHHVAVTRKGSFMAMYLDGTLHASGTFTIHNFTNSDPLQFGRNVCNNQNTSLIYNGEMDEVRFWNRALCQGEINTYRTCQLSGTPTGLSAYYKFNQGFVNYNNAGVTSLTDETGINNGTLVNFGLVGTNSNWVAGQVTGSCTAFTALTVSASSNTPVNSGSAINLNATASGTNSGTATYAWTGPNNFTSTLAAPTISNAGAVHAGIYNVTATANGCTASNSATVAVNIPGGALDLTGSSEYVDLGVVMPANSSFTKEGWVYHTNNSSSNNIFSTNQDPIWIPGGVLNAGQGNNYGVLVDPNPFPMNVWTHVAVTYDQPSSTMKMYVNGVLKASTTNAPAFVGGTMYLGHHAGGSGNSAVKLDEVRLWARALCQAEIANNMNCELVMPQSGLLAYYKFNQGLVGVNNASVTTLTDASGNNKNGTLTGFALSGTTSNWIAGHVTGTCSAYSAPEINVSGNGNNIASGSTATSASNNTDFGSIALGTGMTKGFMIQNTGNSVLNFTGSPTVVISGPNAALFTVTSPLGTSANAGGGLAAFNIQFSPVGTIGVKTATVSIASNDCNENPYTFTISGTATCPSFIAYTLSGGGAICAGQNISNLFFSGSQSGHSYQLKNNGVNVGAPFIGNNGPGFFLPAVSAAGTYTVEATHIASGCKQVMNGSAVVTINSLPTATASTLSPVCEGDTIKLFSSVPGLNYVWTGPNSFTSTAQHPMILNATTAMAGTYSLTATDGNGCSNTSTASLVVNTLPVITASSNSAVCNGTTLNLTAGGGVSYIWSGPNNFSSTAQNPTFTASLADAGTYFVKGTGINGCRNAASVNVVVNALPTVAASGNTPVNAGGTLTLTATGASTYSWSGPNGFSATGNPAIISSVTLAAAGTYTVTGMDANGCVNTGGTTVVVNPPGQALHFDGINDWVQIPVMPAINAIPVTLEAMVKPDLRPEGNVFYPNNVLSNDLPGNHGLGFGANVFAGGSKIVVEYKNGFREILNPAGLAAGQWSHIAVVYNLGNFKVYVNGVLVDDFNYAQAPLNNTVHMHIGKHNDDAGYGTRRFFRGAIDEVRVWNRALCPAEITAQYSCQLNGVGNGLFANYNFDHGFANANNAGVTTLQDGTANNSDGTLQNFGLTGTTSNWIEPGGAGTTCSPYLVGDININGNGKTILNNTTTVSAANNTDMGTSGSGIPITKQFSIENNGTAPITVTGITLTGSQPAQFSVNGISFPVTIPANGSVTYNIVFQGSAVFQHNAIVNIASSDCDEGTYQYAVRSTVNCSMPTFVTCPSNIIVGTTTACSASATYSISASGTPGPGISYTFTGATTASGNGTGSGQVFNKGVTNVRLIASNICGSDTCEFTVIVNDTTRPAVNVQNVTVYLDANGSASITAAQVNNNSTDNCGIASMSVSPSTFSCDDVFATGSGSAGVAQAISFVGTRNFATGTSFGAAYNPNTDEYWYGTWSGSNTVRRFKYNGTSYQQVGSFNVPTNQLIDMWVDKSSNDYYVSHYSYKVVRRYTSNNTVAWNMSVQPYNAGGITADNQYVYVVLDGTNLIRKFNKITGAFVQDLALPGSPTHCYTIKYANGNLYLGGYAPWSALPNNYQAIHVINATTGAYNGSTSTAIDVYNSTFDGEVMWVNNGGNVLYGYKISNGNVFGGGNGKPVVLTVTDVNGNVNTATAVVTVKDTIKPVVTCPSNIVVTVPSGACSTAVNFQATATDNCSAGISYSYSQASGSLFGIGTTSVTVTAKDSSGNVSAPCTFTVTVNAPEINVTGNGQPIADGDATPFAGDNTDFGGTNPGVAVTKTYTIENNGTAPLTVSAINMSGTEAANFVVSGISLPATVVANGIANFNLTFNATALGVKTAMVNIGNDDCNEAVYNYSVTGEITCAPATFTACPSNITVGTATGLCNAVVNYNAMVNGTPAPFVSYTFSGATTGVGSGTGSGQTFNKGVTTVTITAVNPCSNPVCTFTVTVNDNELPVVQTQNITAYLDASGSVTVTPAQVDNGSSDNCGPVTPGFATTTTGTICGTANEGGTVTLAAPAGATITAINFASYGLPNGSCGSFTIGSCHASNSVSIVTGLALGQNSVSIPATNGVFGDPCFGTPKRLYITATYTQPGSGTVPSLTFGCNKKGANTVTLRVTDGSNNSASGTAIVTVSDTTKPVVSCPANVTVNCNASTAPSNTGTATASDNCSASISHSDVSTQSANTNSSAHYNYTITRTWKAIDPSNNSSTCVQTITVQDVTAPSISLPANATVNCQDATTHEANGTATGADNCSSVAISYTDNSTQDANPANSGHYNYTITRTWKSMDVTGNFTTGIQTITVQDVTAPSITVPASVTVNCQDATTPEANGTAAGTDNCSAVAISYADNSTQDANPANSNHYNYTITRTWKSTDATGNFTTSVQTITVQDVTAPSITVPANVTVNCQDDKTPAANGTASGTDNCSSVAVSYTDNSTQDANPANSGHYNYMITRTWKTTDVSGNFTTGVQTITVQDVTKPVITCPASLTVACNASTAIGATGMATASDNCGPVTITYIDASTQDANANNASHYNYTITRTWKATDVTGNFITCDQMITVEDAVAPTIVSCPASVTVNCQDATTTTALGVATGNDDCSPVAVTHSDVSTQDGNANSAAHYNYTITRTWTLKDVTGNSNSCTQMITVQDVTAPAITVPANVTVNCQDATAPEANGTAIGTDNCSAVAISHTDVNTQNANVSNAAHYNYTITRTWKAMDVTGNFTTGVQTITVQDVTAPSITVPDNVTVNCQDDKTPAANGSASGTDNCSAVAISYTDNSNQDTNPANSGHYNYTITRTWKSMDVTGNYTTGVQTITVQDVTAPSITVPGNVTVNCQDDKTPAANGSATGTDNCSAVAISYTDNSNQDANPANIGHYNYTISRTWKSMDVTGNYTTGVQTIIAQDITAPSITVPADVTVNCQDDKTPVANGSATGTDNCSPVVISYTDNSSQDANPANAGHYNYTITRTWKSMDVTGNFTTGTQTITVQDVTAPAITIPGNTIVNCQDDKTPASNGTATGIDNCSSVAISYTDVSTQNTSTNSSAHYNYTITRTWKTMDVTGNYTVASQVITVQDVTAPSIVVPVNKTVNCQDDKSPAANGTATGVDNCSPVSISYTDVSTQNANVNNAAYYNYTIVRTWKSMDVTGNYTTGTQVITVQDITAPSITCPANTTVSCKTSVATNGTATGTDNCSPVTITHSDVSMQNNNPAIAGYYNYTITRTWKATDVSGNYTTCNQVITVNALNNAAIVVNPVNTINANHPNHTIYLGYGPQSVTLTASSLGGVGTQTYSWSPTTGVANPTSASTSVAPTTTTTYTITITDGTGCSITKSVTINVVDVRCGNKIKICHYPPGNTGNPQQLCLPASAIPAHLAHGCKLGDCPSSKDGNDGGDHEFETHSLVVNEVKVYPNPNTGVFYVELPSGMESASVSVTDMAGKLILTKKAEGNKIQIDLGSVAQGMYMVHVTSGDQSYRSRVVVE